MKILLFILCFISLHAFSQEQQSFELKGKLGKRANVKGSITFTLSWTEKDGIAEGTYKDNFYAKSAKLKGISGDLGRIFVVALPRETNGVRTISILSSNSQARSGKVLTPVSIVLRDDKGNPVTTTSVSADLSRSTTTLVAQRQEENCSEGFGELRGYCGDYKGMLTEESDAQKNCDLLKFNESRLILDQNAELGLLLGAPSEIVSTPMHRIGRIIANATSANVDVLSRSCRPLPGTSFAGDNCKLLNLNGTFSIERGTKHFTGIYTITDEKTKQSCRYRLSMDQENE